jgi:hypothetical protein
MYWGEMEGVGQGQGISYQLGLHSLNLGRLSGITSIDEKYVPNQPLNHLEDC